MRTRYTLAKLILMTVVLVPSANIAEGSSAVTNSSIPTLQSLDQYTRIQIPVGSGSTFSLMNGQGESKVTLQKVRPASLAELAALSDGRVNSIQVNRVGIDQVEISIKFRENSTESFAYMQGNVLVLDLWQQDKQVNGSKVVTPLPEESKKVAKAAKKIEKKVRSQQIRKLASEGESESPREFNVVPLQMEKDIFQKFFLPMPEMIEAKGLSISTPPKVNIDLLWKFPIKKADSDEGKAFELAKKLFADKKFGLTVKTIEISRRQFPKSPFNVELDLLEAFAYKKLGESTKTREIEDKSDQMLALLAAKKDEMGNPLPYHLQIRLYFGQKAFSEGNWLEALSQLEFVASKMDPKNQDFPFLQSILADCYIKVNQPQRAERIFRYIAEHHPKTILAKESIFRIISLLAHGKNYPRVIDAGEAALDAYPGYEKSRSESLFHMGEANFWLKNYGASEKYFKKFIAQNSANTVSALAWARLGEISEIWKKDLVAAKERYLEAKNGYPFSPGDLVATTRLARIDINREKEPKFVLKSLQDIAKDKTIDSEHRRATDLVTVDYLLKLGDIEEAIRISRTGMRDNTGVPFEAYKVAYSKSIFAKWSEMVRAKQYPQALALYKDEMKSIDSIGPDSLKISSDMYRGLGLYTTSNDMMTKYALEIRNTKGRQIASMVAHDLDLMKAKNSFARGNYSETLSLLPESRSSEVLFMKAVSEFRLGRKKEAYNTGDLALAAFKRDKESVSDDMVEQIAVIVIEKDDSSRDYAAMEKNILALSSISETENPRLKFALGDSLWYQKRHQEAIVAYQEAIKKFPKGERAERAKYNIGMSQIALGNREAAVKTLTELRAQGNSLWSESAQRELDLIQWEQKYSSVLKTLPPSGLGIVN